MLKIFLKGSQSHVRSRSGKIHESSVTHDLQLILYVEYNGKVDFKILPEG